MDKKGGEKFEASRFKEAILVEIFNAYREPATVYEKTTSPEIWQTLLDLKRFYDRAIHRLSPLAVLAEKLWEELGTRFSG